MNIGEYLINQRKKIKLSQEKMAEKLGISRQTLSNYENNITSPDLKDAKKICDILDISLDELIGNEKTIASKISKTENLVKKQNRLIIIILYLIIMLSLISFIIYALTNNDYTSKYQTEFTCHNRKQKEDTISISLDSDYVSLKKEENIVGDFYIRICEVDTKTKTCLDNEKIYAGKSLKEAIDSINITKLVLTNQNYICH